jgi:hypothetical protein
VPGRGTFSNVQESRIAKTKWYFEDRETFLAQLVKDVSALVRKAERDGFTPLVRLNGTSDIPWERVPVKPVVGSTFAMRYGATAPNIMALFPDVQFYDYTKVHKRAMAFGRGEMPANYHLTFSLFGVSGSLGPSVHVIQSPWSTVTPPMCGIWTVSRVRV